MFLEKIHFPRRRKFEIKIEDNPGIQFHNISEVFVKRKTNDLKRKSFTEKCFIIFIFLIFKQQNQFSYFVTRDAYDITKTFCENNIS